MFQFITDLFLYCYERNFISDLQKSKRNDLIDMFTDTSEFEKHIPDICISNRSSEEHSKDTWFQITTGLEKKIWKVLQVILWAFVQISWNIVPRIYFRMNLSPGLLRWSSLQTKGAKGTASVVSSSSKIVKRIRHRKYDQVVSRGL